MSSASARAHDPVAAAVAAALAGDQAGWDALFDRFYTVVLRYAMSRLGDRHGAEEVAQEVFVAAIDGLRGLRDRREPAVTSWFIGVARHKAADRLRRAKRERPTSEGVRQQDPADLVADRMEAAEVRSALEWLTDEQRDVIIRRFILDQSLEQVAVETRRPVGAVKSMQHRALGALARRLEKRDRVDAA